ncbi:MAG: PH domain-containing protein [Planctomycetota bacterium]
MPPDLLQDGEVVLLMLKPSPWFVPLGALRPVAGLALVAMLLATLNNAALDLGWLGLGGASLRTGLESRDLLLAGAGAVVLRWFWQLLEWLSHVYVLTDRRVLRSRGVLGVSTAEVPLPRLQQIELGQTAKEKAVGVGTITLSDGRGGHADWEMVARPEDVRDAVAQARRRYGGR